ncbi:hypothetical protein VW35_18145 [Devosia soli]|uniref:DUF4037 domain-containing protein n=1 Tax=Devosia soli TaxID=361041 RepID=A0A0F5L389_9HYPH|nr:DUF4037 domain-containing protein [Devosia soli]KKB76680.1 hypothetical protein VW35_18145 [Devosia soli]
MQGIELSRTFYDEIVAPFLASAAPELSYSAALIGYGSELLGFDDETSKDHNWGPRVHIHLSAADFHAHAQSLLADFAKVLPQTFRGEPTGWRARPHPAASNRDSIGALEHGLEFHTIEGRLESHFGIRYLEGIRPVDWLGFPEQKLLSFTAGAVFHDGDGRLTLARRALAYFPDDVWLYRIACHWRRIAEAQAFVGRAGQVGDDLGSRLIAARLVHDVMALGFLLARSYAPYAKWFGTGFSQLPIANALMPDLNLALEATAWNERGEALARAYLKLATIQNEKGVGPFTPVVGPYYDRPFVTINADDAVNAAMAAINDPALRSLPVLGAIDQASDLTPLLVDAVRSQQVARQLLG